MIQANTTLSIHSKELSKTTITGTVEWTGYGRNGWFFIRLAEYDHAIRLDNATLSRSGFPSEGSTVSLELVSTRSSSSLRDHDENAVVGMTIL